MGPCARAQLRTRQGRRLGGGNVHQIALIALANFAELPCSGKFFSAASWGFHATALTHRNVSPGGPGRRWSRGKHMSATTGDVSPSSGLGTWRTPLVIIICGCLIALLSFGPRSSLGFFVQPMSREFTWGRDVFGLALALQNLLWGLGQPIAGAIADRFGILRV